MFVCATPHRLFRWILFLLTHSDRHDMKMAVQFGFCDAASFI